MPKEPSSPKEPSTHLDNSLPSEWAYFISAIMFYTRLPTPKNAAHSDLILNRSRKYFPLIGILIGSIGALTFYLAHLFFAHALAAALSMVATILATGAFHEDGLADSCDGLGGGWSAEQVLTIMKDSRIGTYGVVGLLTVLGLKLLSLISLSNQSLVTFALCYVSAHTISRVLSSLTIECFSYVQDLDLSKVKPITDRRLERKGLIISCAIGIMPLLILATIAFKATLIATFIALVVGLSFARYSNRRIGGYTGDVLGAIQQLSEMAFYLGFLAILSYNV